MVDVKVGVYVYVGDGVFVGVAVLVGVGVSVVNRLLTTGMLQPVARSENNRRNNNTFSMSTPL